MRDEEPLTALLARALSLAYSALASPTDDEVGRARASAQAALARGARLSRRDFTLAESRQIAVLLRELQETLTAAERRNSLARALTGET